MVKLRKLKDDVVQLEARRSVVMKTFEEEEEKLKTLWDVGKKIKLEVKKCVEAVRVTSNLPLNIQNKLESEAVDVQSEWNIFKGAFEVGGLLSSLT